MSQDLYKELGVPRNATAEDIKKAYRKLAAELHPDRNPGNAAAEERFKAVNRAHQALSDKRKRALYDEFGEEGLREGFQPDVARAYRRSTGAGAPSAGPRRTESGTYGGFEDIFTAARGSGLGGMMGDLFGRGPSSERRRGAARGADLASEVIVDFADAVRGATVGLKLQPDAEPIAVRIPAGAGDGDRVRVAGHGTPAPGGTPGDLIITIRVRDHAHFKRDGLDLHLDLPVTPGEAYNGAKVPIPTPEGEVTLKLPPHAQSGQVLRLKGRGVRRKDQVGDLYVKFYIRLPEDESSEVKDAVSLLDRRMRGNPREGLTF